MIRGLYTAAAGLVSGLRQQETVAENLSNVNTPGFKRERTALAEFAGVLARRIGREDAPIPVATQRVLGRVGGGAYVEDRNVHLAAGAERRTDRAFDVMLRGRGFFAVQQDGETLYTRDGHWDRDAQGRLVTADGALVLGTDGAPVALTTDDVRISAAGEVFELTDVPGVDANGDPTVTRQGRLVATLQVVDIPEGTLVRSGGSRFTAAGAVPAALGGADVAVQQGSLEEANVDVGQITTQLTNVARTFEASQHAFRAIDETLQTAASEIGRVEA